MSRESALELLTTGSVTPPPATVEATPAPEAPKETPKPAEDDKARFERLAKHEAKVQADRAALKAEQEASQKQIKAAQDVYKQYSDFEAARKNDPIKALKMLGITEAELVNFLAAEELSPEAKAEKAVDAKIKEYEAKVQAEKDAQTKAQTEAQTQAEQKAVSDFQGQVSTLVKSNKDKFEYCNWYGKEAEDLIWETVVEYHKLDGELLNAQEAAELVENFYEESDQYMAATIKKRSGIQKPQAPAKEAVVPDNEQLTHTGFKGEKASVKPMPSETKNPPTKFTRKEPAAERSAADAVNKTEKKQLNLSKARPTAGATVAQTSNAPPQNMTRAEKKEWIIEQMKSGRYNK